MHSNQCMHQAPDMTSAYQEKLFSFATQCTSRAVMIFTRVTSAAHWWQTSGYEHKATVKHFGGSKWHLFCQQQIEGDMCQGGESHFFTSSPTPLRVNITSSTTRWLEMLVPTDLNCAGVLRIIQQPHSAVAFPVQTPDAAAHQSAQHLLDRLCTGPGTRAHCTYIQVWSSVTLTTSLSCGPTPGQRQRLCGSAAVVHRFYQCMYVCVWESVSSDWWHTVRFFSQWGVEIVLLLLLLSLYGPGRLSPLHHTFSPQSPRRCHAALKCCWAGGGWWMASLSANGAMSEMLPSQS